jgi:hypothetical protein
MILLYTLIDYPYDKNNKKVRFSLNIKFIITKLIKLVMKKNINFSYKYILIIILLYFIYNGKI